MVVSSTIGLPDSCIVHRTTVPSRSLEWLSLVKLWEWEVPEESVEQEPEDAYE